MSKSPSRRFPVTVAQLPVTRCQVCHRTVAYRPGAVTEVLTDGAEEKPRTASLFSSMSPETITLEDALRLLSLPRVVGELDGAISAVIRDNAFIRGPYVDTFEREFADAAEVKHCVSCANGTDALYLAMAALDVKPADEVITTAHSWISTSPMITHAGATVLVCDTDGATFTIDPAAIEAAITPRTVGIIPVHLYGQPADMDAIMAIAGKHKLWLIEDCAQAHLARYRGQQIGSFGAAATYSFYPGKNLGAMGDAGAVVTGDAGLAEHMTMLARHGGLVKHQHRIDPCQVNSERGKLPQCDGRGAPRGVELGLRLARIEAALQSARRNDHDALGDLEDHLVDLVVVWRDGARHHRFTEPERRIDDDGRAVAVRRVKGERHACRLRQHQELSRGHERLSNP